MVLVSRKRLLCVVSERAYGWEYHTHDPNAWLTNGMIRDNTCSKGLEVDHIPMRAWDIRGNHTSELVKRGAYLAKGHWIFLLNLLNSKLKHYSKVINK